ncbi:unnamed protein product [Rhodiola kirilowii]
MSMLDSFFNKGFKGPKCKTLLKLTIPRIKLLRNRREIQIKQMRRDIAKLLETGQEATARIRVEHIIREENMMAAQEIIELFCELISVRIPIIETQRECPLDLKEAISSVCFAAPRCADLPELMPVQMLFVSKYGKEFVAAATELRPDCGVNRQLIELLSVRAPAPEKKLKLLTEIAEEHGLDWDPTSSEIEIFKRPEDLLNGPSQFASGSVLPLPKEKVLTMEPFPSQCLNEDYGADSDSDGLDFPEVPKISVRPKVNEPVKPPAIPPVSATDNKSSKEEAYESTHHQSDLKEEETTQGGTGIKTYELLDEVKTVNSGKYQSYMPPPVLSSPSFPAESGTTFPSISEHGGDVNVHLQDVLAAAQAAADSAERAASAARSAASLAQLRINELVKKKNDEVFESSPSFSSHDEVAHEKITTGNAIFDHQHSFDGSPVLNSPLTDKHPWEHPKLDSDSMRDHVEEVKFGSYGSFGNGSQPELTRDHVEEVKFDSYGSFGNGSQPEITRDHVEEVKIGLYGSFGNGSQPELTRDHVEEAKIGLYGSFGNGSQPELTRDHVEEVKLDSYGSFGNGSQPELTRDRVEEVKFDSYGSFGNGSQSQPELTRDRVEEVKFDSFGSFGNGSQPELTRDRVEEVKFDSCDSYGNGSQPVLTREQPQRCTSMDDDTDFSYHNLFSSKRDNDEASDHSADTTKSGSF